MGELFVALSRSFCVELERCPLNLADVVKVMEDGDLQTIGLLDYEKRLKHSFTAHPKVDPFTGNVLHEKVPRQQVLLK